MSLKLVINLLCYRRYILMRLIQDINEFKACLNLLCYRRYILMRLIQDINEFKACYKSIMLS